MYGYYLAIQELIIILIVVVLLSAAFIKAQFHKSWLSWPQGMILAWKRANKRERLAYENWRHVAIGSHTSSSQAVPHLVLLLPFCHAFQEFCYPRHCAPEC